MKYLCLLSVFSVMLLASCETTEPTDVDTERFYSTPWDVDVNRTHGEVGALPAADEDYSGTVTLSKSGSMTFSMSGLSDHQYQYWGYSWSTDAFYMNWSPCLEWHINEAADSMYLNYDYQSYDPTTQNSFYWNYSVYMTK